MKHIRSLVFLLPILLLTILISACCGDIQLPNSVVAEPLYQAEMPQDISRLADIFDQDFLDELPEKDTYLFDDYLSTKILFPSPVDTVRLLIILYKSDEESEKHYKDQCNESFYQYPHKFTYDGSPGNQYCISYIMQARGGPEGLCSPYEQFLSKTVFQKGHVVVTLQEYARDTNNEELNRAIEILAEQFNK